MKERGLDKVHGDAVGGFVVCMSLEHYFRKGYRLAIAGDAVEYASDDETNYESMEPAPTREDAKKEACRELLSCLLILAPGKLRFAPNQWKCNEGALLAEASKLRRERPLAPHDAAAITAS